MTLSPSKQIFIGVMGAPYESELITSLMRMVDESLAQGHRVIVWTCGGATTLTQSALGEVKPRNLLDLGTDRESVEYPSTAALVKGLIKTAQGRLQWYVCRHCMEERGAEGQIPDVKVMPPYKFVEYHSRAEISLVMGVK